LVSSARPIESAIQNKQHLRLEYVQPVMWDSGTARIETASIAYAPAPPWPGLDQIPGLTLGY
jgi:hypothetical protein